MQANWVADRVRAAHDNRPSLDDYLITDMTFRYTTLKQWEFAASIRNLFDEEAFEHTGRSIVNDFPLAERNFYAEARYKF